MPADSPDWFALVQAHVNAVQANDRAVRLFREGELDEAIVELCSSLEVYPQYATGHSNLGFLYLWRGDLDQALEDAAKISSREGQVVEVRPIMDYS